MLILKTLLFIAALAAVALLALHQFAAQAKDYLFYKRNGWDFSIDSGADKIDQRIMPYDLGLTNGQRFYLFRPLYILMLIWFMGMMIAMGF
ncbi:hypothetical protein ACXIUS_09485 [Bosea thiooxidans]|nr:hypothetical protein [Bosea sp. (in: a-proteobacteria)]